MTKQFFVIAVIIASLAAMSVVIQADVPQLISFQGKLHDNVGDPLTGQYEITFRIYNVESGGTAIWTETTTVSCENGLYNVILGMTTPMTLGFDGDYWLSVQVAGDDELSPRFRIVSVPVAIRAAVAEEAQRVSWNNLTDVPDGFADGTDDVGAAGGVSQVNGGTAVDVTNPTGPTATINHAADASALPNAHHTKTTSATELTSGILDNARLNMGHGNGIDADQVDGKHASEFADSEHQHDNRYYTEAELNTNDGTVNESGDPVSWTKIKDIPAGFADGTDNAGGGAGGGWIDDGAVVRLENGNDQVGIGTTSPNGQFHVRHTSTAVVNIGGNGNNDRVQLGLFEDSDPGEETGVQLDYQGDSDELSFVAYGVGIRGNDLMTIQRDGNVGIGTIAPDKRFHIKSEGSDGGMVMERGGAGQDSKLQFQNEVGTDKAAIVYLGTQDGIAFETGGENERVRITNTGNVGIGTVNPGAKLDVNGDLNVTGEIRGQVSFPRPAYDSGWVSISQGGNITLYHNLGGNIDNYVVDVVFHDWETGLNHQNYGGKWLEAGAEAEGAYWCNLTTQRIIVHRMSNDVMCDKVRVRIWTYN